MCGEQHVPPPFIHSKSRMRKRARTDLRGGRSAMVVPTATVILSLVNAVTGEVPFARLPGESLYAPNT